jgi:hypothetical protein
MRAARHLPHHRSIFKNQDQYSRACYTCLLIIDQHASISIPMDVHLPAVDVNLADRPDSIVEWTSIRPESAESGRSGAETPRRGGGGVRPPSRRRRRSRPAGRAAACPSHSRPRAAREMRLRRPAPAAVRQTPAAGTLGGQTQAEGTWTPAGRRAPAARGGQGR